MSPVGFLFPSRCKRSKTGKFTWESESGAWGKGYGPEMAMSLRAGNRVRNVWAMIAVPQYFGDATMVRLQSVGEANANRRTTVFKTEPGVHRRRLLLSAAVDGFGSVQMNKAEIFLK
jgi:hypothetical protein